MKPHSVDVCLIVEDQSLIRQNLVEIATQAFPGFKVEAAGSLKEARNFLKANLESLKICLIDLGLPDGSGIQLIEQISSMKNDVRLIVVSIYDDDRSLFDSLGAGASGYLLKAESPAYMIESLRKIQRDEPPLSPAIARKLMAHFGNQKRTTETKPGLTVREQETLTLLARGLSVAETATQLGLSAQTVAGYVKIIYQKLHVTNRAGAVREAIRRGLT